MYTGSRQSLPVRGGIANTQLVASELATHTGGDELVTLPLQDGRAVGVTQPRCLFHNALEHGIEVARVGADQLQDLGGRGLQLQRLRQVVVAFLDLAEETGVLDGDRRLIRERLQQGDLVVCVPACGRAGETDRADDLAAPLHRHREGAGAHSASRRVGESSGRLVLPVTDVNRFAVEHRRSGDRRVVDRYRPAADLLGLDRDGPSNGRQDQVVAVADDHQRSGSVAQPVGVVGDHVEHRLQVEASRADGVEHLGHRCLAFERGVEVVEESGVRDRNRRLVGERLQDGRVAGVERSDLSPAEVDVADPFAVVDQWNRGVRPDAGLDGRLGQRVTRLDHARQDVVFEHRFLESSALGAPSGGRRRRPEKRCGLVDLGLAAQLVVVTNPEQSSLRLTERSRAGDDPFEYHREFSRIRTDEPQHFARCRLELERLGKFGVAFLDLGEQPGVVDRDGRLVGEGLQQRQLDVGEPPRCHPDEGDCPEHIAAVRQREGELTPGAGSANLGLRVLVGRDVVPISDVQRLPCCVHGRRRRAVLHTPGVPPIRTGVLHDAGVRRNGDDLVLIECSHVDEDRGVLAEPLRMVHDAVEHRLQIETGGADRVEDVGHRGLAFEGGVEIVEQLGVGHGDGRLVGEGLEDGRLLLVERAHLPPPEVDVADPGVLVEERDRDERLHATSNVFLRNLVVPHRKEVVGEDWRPTQSAEREEIRAASVPLIADERHVVPAHLGMASQRVAVFEPEQPGLGVAQGCGAGDDALEHDGQFTRVGADQLQDLRRCGLEFERLGEVRVPFLDLAEQTGVVDGDRGLIGERLEELDRVVAVATGSFPCEDDGPERLALAHHRYGERALMAVRQGRGVRIVRASPVFGPLGDVDEFAAQDHVTRRRRVVQWVARLVAVDRRGSGDGGNDELAILAQGDHGTRAVSEPVGVVGDAREDRLQVEPGLADGVEHVGHGGLAFEGGVEFVEQPCVRHGEGGLVGERLEDREFGVVERTHLRPNDVDVADPLGLAEQRNRGVAPGVRERLGEFGGDDVEIVECQRGIARRGVGVDVAVVGGELHPDRHVELVDVRCGDPENGSILQQDAAEGCIAQVGGLGHDCLQHGRKIAGVGADQSQRLRGRRLQLQRLGEVGVAFLDLAEESGIVDGDRGLIRERLEERDLRVGVSAGFDTHEGHDAHDFASASHR